MFLQAQYNQQLRCKKKGKRKMKKLITLLFALCVLFSGIISINASEMIVTELESVNIATEEELQPMMARSCKKDPLEYYFGKYYEVTEDDGTWITIEGAGGITGGYNKTTGCGYVKFSDGSREEFQI